MVVADPVIVACLASNWVWIALETPFKYWNSVSEIVPSAILVADIPVGIESLVFVSIAR